MVCTQCIYRQHDYLRFDDDLPQLQFQLHLYAGSYLVLQPIGMHSQQFHRHLDCVRFCAQYVSVVHQQVMRKRDCHLTIKAKKSHLEISLSQVDNDTIDTTAFKYNSTLFENHPKCRILMFEVWYFPPIFVLLKLTCLVTLFDRKLQVYKNSPKWTIFGIFN